MARVPRTIDHVPEGYEIPPDPVSDTVGDIDDDVREDLLKVLADIGESPEDRRVKLKFYRVDEMSGTNPHLFDSFNPKINFVQRIREDYGTGKYECRIYIDGNLKKKTLFAVENPRVKTSEKTDDGVISKLLESQEKMRETLERVIRESSARNNGDQKTTLEMLQIAKTMFDNRGPSFSDNLLKMAPFITPFLPAVVDAIFKKRADNDPLKMLENTMGLIDRMRGFGGGSNDSSESGGLFGMLREAFPQFLNMLQNQQQKEIQQAEIVRDPPAPITPPPASPAPNFENNTPRTDFVERMQTAQNEPPIEPTSDESMMINVAVHTLLRKAKNNEDAESAANGLLDMIPADYLDQVMELIDRADCVDELIKRAPEIAEYREWFEKLRRAILAQFEAPEGDIDNDAPVLESGTHDDDNGKDNPHKNGSSGNAGHVAPNESPSE